MNKKTVVIQGLGFVGGAMAAAVASALDNQKQPLFKVIGVDLKTSDGMEKIKRVNSGIPPIDATDPHLYSAYQNAHISGNLTATHDESVYKNADIIVIDLPLDIHKKNFSQTLEYSFSYDTFLKSLEPIATQMKPSTLVIVETTVPPGTTEKVILPFFNDIRKKRGIFEPVLLAHSYERVMPGKNYLSSITDFYRVYAGVTPEAAQVTRSFLETFINTKEFPLTELTSPTSSETAKVLENSYRAMNIAFIQEWSEFADAANIDLFTIIDAIKRRPTHNNIMKPGFGVGGYCLTKDALLADFAYQNIFQSSKHLEQSLKSVQINDKMPLYSFQLLKKELKPLAGKEISLFGVSYLNDVADTRSSPCALFYDLCSQNSMIVHLHDPLIKYWPELSLPVETNLLKFNNNSEAIVLAVRHTEYINLSPSYFLENFKNLKIILDANNILTDQSASDLMQMGIKVIGLGKGHWNLREKQS